VGGRANLAVEVEDPPLPVEQVECRAGRLDAQPEAAGGGQMMCPATRGVPTSAGGSGAIAAGASAGGAGAASSATRCGLRIPTAFTPAPNASSPAPTSMARWNACVDASRAALTCSGGVPAVGGLRGAKRWRTAADDVSLPGTWAARAL